ncbi:MAG: hypothetical protein J0M35_18450, partial [Candidatus Obscuribacter phosphatis]|nr:hypothetical protein [Candidatus Obscuribacter phosphatis]
EFFADNAPALVPMSSCVFLCFETLFQPVQPSCQIVTRFAIALTLCHMAILGVLLAVGQRQKGQKATKNEDLETLTSLILATWFSELIRIFYRFCSAVSKHPKF